MNFFRGSFLDRGSNFLDRGSVLDRGSFLERGSNFQRQILKEGKRYNL